MAQQRELNIPVPDPSVLTTEQLYREIAALKELLAARDALVNEKFNGVGERPTISLRAASASPVSFAALPRILAVSSMATPFSVSSSL